MVNSSELFPTLRKYVRGQSDKYDIERSDPDIYRVIEHPTKGMTEIQFEFKNDEDFLKLIGVSDDDIWFVNAITSPYSDYNFMDISTVEEDFKEGYNVFWDLNDENLDLCREILKVLDPSFDYSELGREESSNKRAASIFLKLYERETERILDDYHTELNRGARDYAESFIDEELKSELKDNEIKFVRKWDTVSVSVGNLIMLYLKGGKVWLSFRRLLQDLYSGNEISGLSEDQYDYVSQGNFDKESFNREVNWQLEKIKDKIDEDENLPNFIKFYDRITKNFKVGQTYDLPKLKGVQFRIKDFDRDNMKVEVVLRKGLKTVNRKVSEENFYNLLYQPEIFYSEFGSV